MILALWKGAKLRPSLGVRVSWARNADSVVGKLVVHLWHIYRGHMAGDAVLRINGTPRPGAIGCRLVGGGCYVTVQAYRIVR